ncbi:MAG TPA: hypothetical protein VKX96_05165 [Chloroflexota bacterium]|nr:hypothetical protein [Chloroflexota bacterium]
MRERVRRANGLEILIGFTAGLLLLAVGSLSLWTPSPLPVWTAAALWLVVVGALLGWNWRLQLILCIGLTLGLTAGWISLVRNDLVPPARLQDDVAYVCVTLVVMILASILVRQAKQLWEAAEADLQRQVALLSEMTVLDPDTGLYKLDKGLEVLRREIQRLRRNNLPLTVVRMRPREPSLLDHWRTAVRLIPPTLRTIDVVIGASDWEVGLILPETDLEGAETVVDRTRHQLEDALNLDVHTGMAMFPFDAVTADGLWQEAGYALDLALEAHIPVVSRRLMGSEAPIKDQISS